MTSVLHVAQPVDGGVGRYVAELASAECAAGLQVTVASPGGWLADEVRRHGVAWRQWDAARSPGRSVAGEARALRQVLGAVEPQVLHLHSSKAGLVGRLVVRGRRPTIFQPHGWPWQAVRGAVAAASTGWERLAVRWTTLLVCVSRDELEAGRRHGVEAAGAEVVRNGVDLSRFVPASAGRRAQARAALGLPPDAPIAVCVGRLNEQKGQELLVEGWPLVLDRLPAARLVLVGAGPAAEHLRALAARRGVGEAVSFAGEDMQVERWYAAADVVAFSSRWGEAMPLTPLEAMASGLPVVATDVQGVREALGPGCGAIVPAGDVAAFAVELARRLGDPAAAAAEGAAARQWAEQHHDARAAYARLGELTRRLDRR